MYYPVHCAAPRPRIGRLSSFELELGLRKAFSKCTRVFHGRTPSKKLRLVCNIRLCQLEMSQHVHAIYISLEGCARLNVLFKASFECVATQKYLILIGSSGGPLLEGGLGGSGSFLEYPRRRPRKNAFVVLTEAGRDHLDQLSLKR